MKEHELKTWPEFFDAVDRGDKTFEVRRDDRSFQVGDRMKLIRWDPHTRRAVDRDGKSWPRPQWEPASITVRITYKLPGGRFGIDEHHCVLGITKDLGGSA